jgi:hypothetical protein
MSKQGLSGKRFGMLVQQFQPEPLRHRIRNCSGNFRPCWPIAETVAGHVRTLFELQPRGSILAKHERAHEMFFLNRLKPESSRDPEGRISNENFAAECNRLLTGFSG